MEMILHRQEKKDKTRIQIGLNFITAYVHEQRHIFVINLIFMHKYICMHVPPGNGCLRRVSSRHDLSLVANDG